MHACTQLQLATGTVSASTQSVPGVYMHGATEHQHPRRHVLPRRRHPRNRISRQSAHHVKAVRIGCVHLPATLSWARQCTGEHDRSTMGFLAVGGLGGYIWGRSGDRWVQMGSDLPDVQQLAARKDGRMGGCRGWPRRRMTLYTAATIARPAGSLSNCSLSSILHACRRTTPSRTTSLPPAPAGGLF